LHFEGDKGTFAYVNEQGYKEIPFGLGYNEFGSFPQEGYSDEMALEVTTGHFYKCAASASWVESEKLFILVQIIDKYFGNLGITIGFKDDRTVVYMQKEAEYFLMEYEGFAGGQI